LIQKEINRHNAEQKLSLQDEGCIVCVPIFKS